MSTQSFTLTKEYIYLALKPLEEVDDLETRSEFFKKYIVEDVTWTLAGNAHELAGTSHSLSEHNAATFNRLGKKLVKPIKFTVRSVILESDSQRACVELQGQATRKNGKPYNNEYVWVTRWNNEGKIVEIRSYFDTLLAQQTLEDP